MKKITVTAFALILGASAVAAECLDAGYEVIPNTGGTACHFTGEYQVAGIRTGDGKSFEGPEFNVFTREGKVVRDDRDSVFDPVRKKELN